MVNAPEDQAIRSDPAPLHHIAAERVGEAFNQETMMFDNDGSAMLKTLADTLADSVNGYRDAAKHVENPQYGELFISLAEERDRTLRDMNKVIYAEGGEPDRDGTTLGHLHQRWLDFKATLTGRDDKAVINEVERGEDYLKEKFEAALGAGDLKPSARATIETAYASVRTGHDRVSALKQSLEAAS